MSYNSKVDYVKTYKFGTEVSQVFANKVLPLTHNKKVLDVGCGTGEYLKYFSPESLGLDISPLNLEEAQKNNLRVKQADLNAPPALEEKFDCVFCSHVLEHVENPISLLRYIYDHLEADGTAIISIPNENSLIHLKYPYFTMNSNHLYSFSIANMKELLMHTGFELLEVHYDYYTEMTNRAGINKVLEKLDYLPRSLKTKVSWAYWFIATKKSS